jgi:hypothetical protein
MKLARKVVSMVTGTVRDAAPFVRFSAAVVKLLLEAAELRFAVVKLGLKVVSFAIHVARLTT